MTTADNRNYIIETITSAEAQNLDKKVVIKSLASQFDLSVAQVNFIYNHKDDKQENLYVPEVTKNQGEIKPRKVSTEEKELIYNRVISDFVNERKYDKLETLFDVLGDELGRTRNSIYNIYYREKDKRRNNGEFVPEILTRKPGRKPSKNIEINEQEQLPMMLQITSKELSDAVNNKLEVKQDIIKEKINKKLSPEQLLNKIKTLKEERDFYKKAYEDILALLEE